MASLGQMLRQERESRNISIEEIASATKIVPRYLEALEDDHLDRMPGGFFVRGIIRTYAKAVGLDPDEILARYRAAGLIGSPDLPTAAPARPSPEPPAPHEPVPVRKAEAAPADEAAPSLLFEEVAPSKLSGAKRKKVLAWTWRAVAALVIVAAVVLVWPSLRSKPAPPEPSTVVAKETLPAPSKVEPGEAPAVVEPKPVETGAAGQPAAQPSAQPGTEAAAAAPPAPTPAPAGEDWTGLTIEIAFQAETWIQVRADGEVKIDGIFPAGTTARARADERLLIHTGNAGGFTFLLNGRPAKRLGRSGQVLTDIKITTQNYKDFLEAPTSGLPPE